jgi:hypothetical protein
LLDNMLEIDGQQKLYTEPHVGLHKLHHIQELLGFAHTPMLMNHNHVAVLERKIGGIVQGE